MTRITTVVNQKGGVGKTTTAHALLGGLRLRGKTPLLVDADPQGNATYTLGVDAGKSSLYEALRGEITARDAIQHTAQGDILPASLLLTAADLEFTQTGREYLLRDVLQAVADDYSHIIIDCPPTLGILTINALTASTDVIIPMGADIYSLQGLSQLYHNIERVQRYCNPQLRIAGLLITRHNSRTILNRELAEAIQEAGKRLHSRVYGTVIREGIAVKEAQTQQANLMESHPEAKATKDYLLFVDEYLAEETGA